MACLEITDKILTDVELINLYKSTKDKYYIEELWCRYERLLNKIAYKYSHINFLYSYEDLISETYISLVKAAEMYKPDKATFTTFLFTVVNQRLYALVNGTTSKDKGNKLLNCCVSIYQTLSDKDDQCMIIDTINDITAEEAFNLPEIMFMADLRRAEEEAINRLSPKQKLVVEAVNGFNSILYTQAELARELGVTTGAVNNNLQEAYRHLRRNKQLRNIYFTEFVRY